MDESPEVPVQADPVRVHLVNADIPMYEHSDVRLRRRGLVTRTVTLTSDNPIQQVLPLNARRCEAWIQPLDADVLVGQDPADVRAGGGGCARLPGPGGPAAQAYKAGAVAAPGAGATIATIPAAQLPAGWYAVRVHAGFGTNPEATTDFNMSLKAGNVTLAANLGVTTVANNIREFVFDRVYLDGTQALTVAAVAAGSASSIYVAGINAVGQGAPAAGPYPIITTDPLWATAPTLPARLTVVSIVEER